LFAALLLRASKVWQRVASAAGLCIIGWLLLSFQTRSVLLGIAAGFLVLLVAASRERKRAFIAIGLCSLALAAALFASPSFRHRIVSGSFSDRIGIWHDAVEIVKLEPGTGKYFGIGYGHGIFIKVEKHIPGKTRGAKYVYNHTHNMILETLVETGWPGLLAWLALLGTAAWRIVRALLRAGEERRWTLATLAAALVTLTVYGQFSAFFALAPFFLFWNLLGIAAAAASPPHPEFQSLEKRDG
jgi:O-antigen ligase